MEEEACLDYEDGITLFHAFFNSFNEFVKKEKPEWKTEIDHKTPWYPPFAKELKKLNKHYKELKRSGRIEGYDGDEWEG